MSDFGMFESDEATQAEPRLAAKTAGRKMEAAVESVRASFGRFLIGATGIDEFEDRWHLSKNDIRASVEPLVFPNTGTMRRIKNALKQDWKLAHPYKLAVDHDDAGFGSMPTADGHRNQDLQQTYHPSSGNLIPQDRFHEWKDSVDQGGPEKVEANDFTPGGDSGSARSATRRVARDPRHYDQVGHEYDSINDPVGSPEIMEDEGDHQGVHDYYRNMMEEPPAGYPRRDRSFFEDEKSVVRPSPEEMFGNHNTSDSLGTFVEDSDPAARYLGSRHQGGEHSLDDFNADHGTSVSPISPFTGMPDDTTQGTPGGEIKWEGHLGSNREAAKMVADIYTDFAQSNGLRVASLDSLDHYASTGIAEADYRLLQSMIVRAAEEAEEKAPEESEDDEDDEDDSEVGDEDFGGESGSEDDSDDDSDDEDDSDDDDEEYDFGGGGDSGGGDQGGGQQYTVPDQAPDLDPQMLNEIPHDNPQGAAPVPPNVIDSLLGLPEGTIEQLLLEEVEQGQGGAPEQGGGDPGFGGGAPDQGGAPDFGGGDQGAPQAGGDDFLGQGGDDAEQEPPRTARRRQAAASPRDYSGDDGQEDKYNRSEKRWKEMNPGLDRTSDGRVYETPRHKQEAPQFNYDEDFYKGTGEGPDYGRNSARRFWAADGDQEPQEDPSGGGQPPQGDPAQGGGDPAAMGGGQPMMPPPGSGAVAPPAPPAPLENQPAEDALLDTANQAIMQMIDQETAEYQQIIAPLSQALQAVQMAQQVEQTEHPMDVTPSEGTVDVSPSQAPGGAQNPQQQLARLMRQAQVQQRQRKVDFALRNAAHLIGNTYGVSERMLVAAMGRRQYEHVAEAFQILPPQARQDPYVQAAALHVGKMFAAENPMFSHQKWMDSVIGQRTASSPRDRAGDAWRDGRDRGVAEHGRQDAEDYGDEGPLVSSSEPWQGFGDQGHPQSSSVPWSERHRIRDAASRGRHPFDRPRLAGETMKNTPTMDRFEFANEQPEITDNMTINDLPKPTYKGLPKHKAERRLLGWGTKGVAPKMPKMPGEKAGDDVMGKYQRYTQQRADKGLNFGDGDVTVENFVRDRKIGDEASGKLHNSLGINHPPVPKATAPKAAVPKAKNPVTKRGTWGEWEPTNQASFFTRRVSGWKWDDHLSGYISKEGKDFQCSCGQKIASPSYKSCDCGKIWNVYAIGDQHHLGSNTADMFIAREIPVRDNVIMANRKMAGIEPPQIHDHMYEIDDTGLPYWLKDEHERRHAGALRDLGSHERLADFLVNHAYTKLTDANLSGNDEEADKWYPRSCQADDYLKAVQHHTDTQPKKANRKKAGARAEKSHTELIAMIDKLADWTKYDGPDPARAFGKDKPASTDVSPPPSDWATRLPKGDPSKKGGTWTRPTIPRKKK